MHTSCLPPYYAPIKQQAWLFPQRPAALCNSLNMGLQRFLSSIKGQRPHHPSLSVMTFGKKIHDLVDRAFPGNCHAAAADEVSISNNPSSHGEATSEEGSSGSVRHQEELQQKDDEIKKLKQEKRERLASLEDTQTQLNTFQQEATELRNWQATHMQTVNDEPSLKNKLRRQDQQIADLDRQIKAPCQEKQAIRARLFRTCVVYNDRINPRTKPRYVPKHDPDVIFANMLAHGGDCLGDNQLFVHSPSSPADGVVYLGPYEEEVFEIVYSCDRSVVVKYGASRDFVDLTNHIATVTLDEALQAQEVDEFLAEARTVQSMLITHFENGGLDADVPNHLHNRLRTLNPIYDRLWNHAVKKHSRWGSQMSRSH